MKFIHPTAIIGENVIIEDDVYIGAYCLIGLPPEWKGKENIDKGVLIGKGTRLTGMVTIDSGAEHQTQIGENCYIMKHSYIAHDCIISNDVTICAGVKLAGHTLVARRCNIGMNAVVHQRQIIAEGCMIGMGAVITKKLITTPYKKYVGNPAKCIGENLIK